MLGHEKAAISNIYAVPKRGRSDHTAQSPRWRRNLRLGMEANWLIQRWSG